MQTVGILKDTDGIETDHPTATIQLTGLGNLTTFYSGYQISRAIPKGLLAPGSEVELEIPDPSRPGEGRVTGIITLSTANSQPEQTGLATGVTDGSGNLTIPVHFPSPFPSTPAVHLAMASRGLGAGTLEADSITTTDLSIHITAANPNSFIKAAWTASITAAATTPDEDIPIPDPSALPDGEVLQTSAGAWIAGPDPGGGVGGALSTLSATLAAPVMLSSTAWVDILTLVLTAGTWLLSGQVNLDTGASDQTNALRVWDGASTLAGAGATYHAGWFQTFPITSPPIIVASSTTIHVQGRCNTGTPPATAIASVPDPPITGGGVDAVSHITALKIA